MLDKLQLFGRAAILGKNYCAPTLQAWLFVIVLQYFALCVFLHTQNTITPNTITPAYSTFPELIWYEGHSEDLTYPPICCTSA